MEMLGLYGYPLKAGQSVGWVEERNPPLTIEDGGIRRLIPPYKILLDYQSGLRSEDERSKLMTAAVEPMSQQDMADVAVYYASLPAHEATAKAPVQADAERLVRQGDPTRLLTPCASCHGVKGQGGKEAAPALAGQSEKAFIRTMTLYKNGARDNDVNKAMAQFAGKLTDEEIRQLAVYYHGR
jgi:cytochrome c553